MAREQPKVAGNSSRGDRVGRLWRVSGRPPQSLYVGPRQDTDGSLQGLARRHHHHRVGLAKRTGLKFERRAPPVLHGGPRVSPYRTGVLD